jgi:hypothetical protein
MPGPAGKFARWPGLQHFGQTIPANCFQNGNN